MVEGQWLRMRQFSPLKNANGILFAACHCGAGAGIFVVAAGLGRTMRQAF
jgi:hypothetical protein